MRVLNREKKDEEKSDCESAMAIFTHLSFQIACQRLHDFPELGDSKDACPVQTARLGPDSQAARAHI